MLWLLIYYLILIGSRYIQEFKFYYWLNIPHILCWFCECVDWIPPPGLSSWYHWKPKAVNRICEIELRDVWMDWTVDRVHAGPFFPLSLSLSTNMPNIVISGLSFHFLHSLCSLTFPFALQGLCITFALVLKALGPHPYYDSDEEFASESAPLLRDAAGQPSDSWSIRINEKVVVF